MYDPTASPPAPPPIPPPKPSSHDASRLGTPSAINPPHPPPLQDNGLRDGIDPKGKGHASDASGLIPATTSNPHHEPVPDPGDQWLPKVLEEKSKQDLAEILGSQELLNALTHSPSTIHPSLAATEEALLVALDENVALARHLTELESRLSNQRASTQAQLLSTHALERQWRQKQSEMDHTLAPFAPSSLYHRLTQSLQEQEMVCLAMEESFLEGDGALATERETLEWVRRYRDAKKLYYLRQERKERWNERRVGGWR